MTKLNKKLNQIKIKINLEQDLKKSIQLKKKFKKLYVKKMRTNKLKNQFNWF